MIYENKGIRPHKHGCQWGFKGSYGKTRQCFRDSQGVRVDDFRTRQRWSVPWHGWVGGLNISLYTVKSVTLWRRWSGKQNSPHQSFHFICHVIHHVQTSQTHTTIKMLKQWWISVSNSIVFHILKAIPRSMDIQVNNCVNNYELSWNILYRALEKRKNSSPVRSTCLNCQSSCTRPPPNAPKDTQGFNNSPCSPLTGTYRGFSPSILSHQTFGGRQISF